MEKGLDPESPKIAAEPALDIQIIPEDPEEMAAREGIQERIQGEIHHEDWNEVPELIIEDGDILPEDMRPYKRRRDEISQGRRK